MECLDLNRYLYYYRSIRVRSGYSYHDRYSRIDYSYYDYSYYNRHSRIDHSYYDRLSRILDV